MSLNLTSHPVIERVVEIGLAGLLGWGGFAVVDARMQNVAQSHDIAALQQNTTRIEGALPRIESAITDIRLSTGRIDERTAFLVGVAPATKQQYKPADDDK